MTVLFPVKSIPLRELAEHSGLGFADVAALTGIPTSTLSRWWKDPNWATRSNGSTLHQIATAVPELSDYLIGRGLTTSVERQIRTLHASGVVLRLPVRISANQANALGNALGVATAILNGQHHELFRRLSLGWGLGHDKFIDAIFAPAPSSLFIGGERLLSAALAIHETELRETSSTTVVGDAVLKHKLTKYLGHDALHTPKLSAGDMRSAFMHRSLTISRILRENNLDHARKYQREVQKHLILARNEQWSLLTFASGRRLPKVFSMPVTTPDHVHDEVVNDVRTMNEAYLAYLNMVALPTAQLFAPSHPEPRARLHAALESRLSAGVSDRQLRRDLDNLRRNLQHHTHRRAV